MSFRFRDVNDTVNTIIDNLPIILKEYSKPPPIVFDIDETLIYNAPSGSSSVSPSMNKLYYKCLELKLPIYYIGVGEKTDDLIPFDLASYIKGLTAIEIEMENG